jgi:class 3 adenylate cyclase/tetratricopeptide (TPR) repeat protein
MRDVPEPDGSKPIREAASLVRFAGLVLDLDANALARDSGEAIPLTRGEFALLRVFATRPGRVVSRDTLLDALAHRRFEPFDRSVDVLVGRLRRKIEPDPKHPSIIVTVPGSGYKFRASVRSEGPTAIPEPAVNSVNTAPHVPERRHITVLCAELLPAEGQDLPTDPEDLHATVDAFRRCVAEALALHGAVIGESHGREVVAYFGYPLAQENDAERAVRAALAIQRALSEVNGRNTGGGRPDLSARIGLEMGPVIVDSVGEVFGIASTIAAQVRAVAAPHSVLITQDVQRQIAGLFVAEQQQARYFEDARKFISLYRVVHPSGAKRSRARTLTPLVGREDELEHLTRRWERARKGEGQLVVVVGEPGIGKSRLIEEFRTGLGETPHTFVEWSSSQMLQNSPLHPIAEWGRQRFGAEASTERRRADLEKTLNLVGLDSAENLPLIAPLLEVALAPGCDLTIGPEELRRRQLAALVAWVLASAHSQTVALAFEDLHWADPTSLDLMRALAEHGARAPLFIIATARPEFRASWSMRSHHSVISLGPLDRAQVRQMVVDLTSRHALSNDVIEGVSERTGGVPLLVEEVTRLLLERGEPDGALSIPLTLQQSLAARLDRLGPAREVAQIGAVLGREFAYPLLRGVAEMDELELQTALEQLAGADILFVEGVVPHVTYRYKHVLIRDAAYDSLVKSQRQTLHRRAAETLRDACGERASEYEVIAHHFTEAGLDNLAIEWWGKAGVEALRRSALQEAIAHLGKAIAMADKAEGTSDTAEAAIKQRQRRRQLRVAYGNALIAARGFSDPETAEAFAKARALSAGEKGAPDRFAADVGLWGASYTRGDLPSMKGYAATLLASVEPIPDSPEAGVAHRLQGMTHWFAGEFREAREHLERALALFQPGRDDEMALRFYLDPGVSTMGSLAFVLWPLGEIDRADSLIERMEMRIAGLTHAHTLALGKAYAIQFAFMRRKQQRLAESALALTKVEREHDLSGFAMFIEGLARAESDLIAGLEEMRRGAEGLRARNVVVFDGLVKIALAEAEASAGNAERAIATLDEALATAERLSYRAFQAELYRARGELLGRDGSNLKLAEEAFLAAIALARDQSARSYELRAAMALAKLYQSTGRSAEAYGVLAAAFEGFSPTPEMPEIAGARVLLKQLEGGRDTEVTARLTPNLTPVRRATIRHPRVTFVAPSRAH